MIDQKTVATIQVQPKQGQNGQNFVSALLTFHKIASQKSFRTQNSICTSIAKPHTCKKRVKCSCISPARTLYEAKAPRTPLRTESATPTIKPISAHLPIALARTGVVFWKHRNRIRPITGNKNARMFRPVDGLSSCWFAGACTAQPQFGHTTASSTSSLPH